MTLAESGSLVFFGVIHLLLNMPLLNTNQLFSKTVKPHKPVLLDFGNWSSCCLGVFLRVFWAGSLEVEGEATGLDFGDSRFLVALVFFTSSSSLANLVRFSASNSEITGRGILGLSHFSSRSAHPGSSSSFSPGCADKYSWGLKL